jgi:putative hydrolase of HD superfamily
MAASTADLDFIRESDKLKLVLRRSLIHDGSRRENTAEHSWQLAVAVLAYPQWSNEPIQMERALKMALLHDLVEIDAGDTFVYDSVGALDKHERERKAADRLYGLLPGRGDELKNLWLEYEKQACPESRYVNAWDRFLPILANSVTGGHSWNQHGVRAAQVRQRNAEIQKGSKTLWEIGDRLINEAVANGILRE